METSTVNLLHPRQVTELRETKAQLAGILSGPDYIRRQLQDGGALVAKQIGEIDRMLEQAPRPFEAAEIDDAVKMEIELRERWLQGMPTQAEMRRNMSGAVDKHTAWQKRSKPDVLKWKHIRRRLHASGVSEHKLDDEGDVSNIEMFRPAGGSQELNMHNEQIPGKVIQLPPPGAGPATVMRDEDAQTLRQLNPELYDEMATLTNEQRAEVLARVRRYNELPDDSEAVVQTKSPKPWKAKAKASGTGWTPERRQAQSERIKRTNAAKKAARTEQAKREALGLATIE